MSDLSDGPPMMPRRGYEPKDGDRVTFRIGIGDDPIPGVIRKVGDVFYVEPVEPYGWRHPVMLSEVPGAPEPPQTTADTAPDAETPSAGNEAAYIKRLEEAVDRHNATVQPRIMYPAGNRRNQPL